MDPIKSNRLAMLQTINHAFSNNRQVKAARALIASEAFQIAYKKTDFSKLVDHFFSDKTRKNKTHHCANVRQLLSGEKEITAQDLIDLKLCTKEAFIDIIAIEPLLNLPLSPAKQNFFRQNLVDMLIQDRVHLWQVHSFMQIDDDCIEQGLVKTYRQSITATNGRKAINLDRMLQSNMFTRAHIYDDAHLHPIAMAAWSGNLGLVKKWVSAGMPIDHEGGCRVGGLHIASTLADTSILVYLLEPQHKKNSNAQDQQGCTPLHRAIDAGQLEAVKLLCQHNVKMDVQDKYGDTPLHLAVAEGYMDIIVWLFSILSTQQKMAYLILQNTKGYTPLHYAIALQRLDIVQFFMRQFVSLEKIALLKNLNLCGHTLLHYAIVVDRIDILQAFIQDLTNQEKIELLNTQDKEGDILLNYVVAAEQKSIVECFLGTLTELEKLELMKSVSSK